MSDQFPLCVHRSWPQQEIQTRHCYLNLSRTEKIHYSLISEQWYPKQWSHIPAKIVYSYLHVLWTQQWYMNTVVPLLYFQWSIKCKLSNHYNTVIFTTENNTSISSWKWTSFLVAERLLLIGKRTFLRGVAFSDESPLYALADNSTLFSLNKNIVWL